MEYEDLYNAATQLGYAEFKDCLSIFLSQRDAALLARVRKEERDKIINWMKKAYPIQGTNMANAINAEMDKD